MPNGNIVEMHPHTVFSVQSRHMINAFLSDDIEAL